MEQSPVLGPIFHARVISECDHHVPSPTTLHLLLGLSSVLFLLDYFFVLSAYSHTIARGASVQIVFGFEVSGSLTPLIVLIRCTLVCDPSRLSYFNSDEVHPSHH